MSSFLNEFSKTNLRTLTFRMFKRIVPVGGNGAHAPTWDMQFLLNENDFQQAKTLVKLHSFTFIILMLIIQK